MKRLLMIFALLVPSVALADVPNPPPLNGNPVIDAANIIPDDEEATLNTKLLDIQAKSKHQVAVLTVPDLGGYEIEDYSINAARFYGLGGRDGDDGVLITVAPNEHKTRIEVGVGLTGMLTDATSSIIIRDDMVPRFKEGDFVGGINAGVDGVSDIIVPLTPAQLLAKQRAESERKAREARQWASFKDTMMTIFFWLLGGAGLFGGYRAVTAPARRRKREAEEQAELEREAELQKAIEAERQRRVRAAEEAQRKHDAWWASLTPAQKKEEQRKAAAIAAAAEEERRKRAVRRRDEERRSSTYGGSGYSNYGGGYSSSSSGSFGGFSGGGFSGGGGSFGGGGASGSW